MKDARKSRALQACRLLVKAYEEAIACPPDNGRRLSVPAEDLREAVNGAREALWINSGGFSMRSGEKRKAGRA